MQMGRHSSRALKSVRRQAPRGPGGSKSSQGKGPGVGRAGHGRHTVEASAATANVSQAERPDVWPGHEGLVEARHGFAFATKPWEDLEPRTDLV